jgi:small subunit ribosomal protein S20
LPTTRTAEKEMRVADTRKERNKSIHSQTKTKVSHAEHVIASAELDAAKAEVKKAISALDKESGKGKVHPNNAARRKSRLMKKLNKASAAAAPATKTESKKKK